MNITPNQPPKIRPFLWFNGNAEEAMLFYTSVFRNASPGKVYRNGAGGPGAAGEVMSVTFVLEGQEFMALNGGPHFTFSPAISFFVQCDSQQEVDELWEKLAEGGMPQQCGWLQDKFGVSWQLIPAGLEELLHGQEPAKSARAMQAMHQMKKIDLAALQQAYEGNLPA